MASGDVQGFASVAFPIVRRVFGGLVANELVSVQPMSLPSGLIFFLDFTHSGDTTGRLGGNGTGSVYGGDVIASQITGGVDLSQTGGAEKSFYNLNNGYASPTGSVAGLTSATASLDIGVTVAVGSLGDAAEARVRYDPDLLAAGFVAEASVTLSQAQMDTINLEDLIAIEDVAANDFPSGSIVRRLTNRTGLTLSFILWSATTFDNSGNNSTSLLAMLLVRLLVLLSGDWKVQVTEILNNLSLKLILRWIVLLLLQLPRSSKLSGLRNLVRI